MLRIYYRAVILLLGLLFWSRVFFLAFAFPNIRGMPIFTDWFLFVLTSVRFDLMVIGYCLTPFLFLTGASIFIKRLNSHIIQILNWNILLAIFILTVISILDVQHFNQFQDRFNMLGLEVLKALHFSFSLFFIITSGALVYFAYLSVKALQKTNFQLAQRTSWLEWLIMILVTATMIRSSFGDHHLDLRHAEVTTLPQLNKIIIPSAYALDQALRGRR